VETPLSSAPLALAFTAYATPLAKPFRVAGFTLTNADTVVVSLRSGDSIGYGESAPLARYGDTVAAIVAFYESFELPSHAGPFSRARVVAGVPRAARCAIDIAFYDLMGHVARASVTEILGLEGLERPATSQTISIEDLPSTLCRARALGDAPVVKVKVGSGPLSAVIDLLETIRSVYRGAIRLDINEGWSAEQAVEILNEIDRFGIEFCEQPIPAGHPEQIRWVSERSKIPIMIDEDALEADQLARFYGGVYAVNIKLAKCGGIAAALQMIAAARALKLKVMLGCMAETRVLATAAAHLGPLADWLDIDGPLLLREDPFRGIDYANGRIVMPRGPGLGVAPVASNAC
jgi:L-alanine-DL-glutamate epimerase-like enolase superfamily enzyme